MNKTTIMTKYFQACKANKTTAQFFAMFGLNMKDNEEECAKIRGAVAAMKTKFAKKLFGGKDKWPKLADARTRDSVTFEDMQDILNKAGFTA
mgnify:CR=1 FL=1